MRTLTDSVKYWVDKGTSYKTLMNNLIFDDGIPASEARETIKSMLDSGVLTMGDDESDPHSGDSKSGSSTDWIVVTEWSPNAAARMKANAEKNR